MFSRTSRWKTWLIAVNEELLSDDAESDTAREMQGQSSPQRLSSRVDADPLPVQQPEVDGTVPPATEVSELCRLEEAIAKTEMV